MNASFQKGTKPMQDPTLELSHGSTEQLREAQGWRARRRARRRGARPSWPGALRWLAVAAAMLACSAEERPPLTGKALYVRHCASCHGASGKGDGPVASSLKLPPADLTTIARRAGGRFDQTAVLRIIDGRRIVGAHGEREMPVWGAVFSDDLQGQPYAEYKVLLNAGALTDYLRSIQVD